MSGQAWFTLLLFLAVLAALAYPLGIYMARIADAAPIGGFIGRLERGIYRAAGVDPHKDMPWTRYAVAVLLFGALGVVVVYLMQRLQVWLPLNPQAMANVSADSAFNTAVSFVTNTNWQGYGGESTMSYFTQMLALAVQNFLSAATGIAVAFALIRGFARRSAQGIGNFWVDLTRGTLYILLPLSLLLAVIFMGQGVIQNFDTYKDVDTVESLTYTQPKLDAAGQPLKDAQGNAVTETLTTHTQTLAMGPVASQEAIKMLGTNGGGFFNANSAHPYENPTPLSNFLQMIAMFLIPAGLCFTFGRMVGDSRQGWAVFSAMTVIFVVMAVVAIWAEGQGNPLFAPLGVDQTSSALQAGGNMEGKETRFGIVASALFATITTAASCGAVNAVHDSFTPLGGMVPMWLIQLGEVVFGGVGAGLYGMLIFAIMAVFVAGPDDRPHTGIHRQEDRVIRNENDLDRHSGDAVPGAGRHRDRGHDARRAGWEYSIPERMASRKSSTPCRRRPTTTAAPSPGSRPIRPSTTPCWPWPCGSGASPSSFRCWPSPDPSPRRNASKPPPALCRLTGRCSSRCWWAPWCWWVR